MKRQRMNTIVLLLIAVVVMASPSVSHAGLLKTLAKGARSVAGKLLGETAEAGSKSATKALSRHTDDAVRLAVRNSDDITRAGIKSADDLAAVGVKGGVGVFRPGGVADDIAGFASRNKGVIVGGAVLGTLVTSPDAVLGAVSDTTVGLAEVAGENIAKPMIAEAGDALAPVVPAVATHLMWIVGVVLLISVAMMCRKHHRQYIEALRNRSADASGVGEVNAGSHQSLLSRIKNWHRR